MNTLTRWEPLREMQTMRTLMDRLMDEPFFGAPQLWNQRNDGFQLPLDVIEEEGQYIVKASVPGVEPDQVEITLTDNVLTIKGETKRESERTSRTIMCVNAAMAASFAILHCRRLLTVTM